MLKYALLCALACAQVPEQPRFKAESAAVLVDVVVTDGKGRPVGDLTADDFRLFEEGERQRIVSAEAPAAAGRTGSEAPRFLTLVIDQSSATSAPWAIDAAIRYVQQLGEGDYISIYAVARRVHLVLPASNRKPEIVEALKALKGRRWTENVYLDSTREADENEIFQLEQMAEQLGENDPTMRKMLEYDVRVLTNLMWMRNAFQAQALFTGLRAISQSLGTLAGRKQVVLFAKPNPNPAQRWQVHAVVDAANRANVAIYVVDPAGLGIYSTPDPLPQYRSAGMDPIGGFNKFDMMYKVTGVLHADMQEIADKTGGLLFKNRNDLSGPLARIGDDLRDYYVLSYQPRNLTYDGSFRRIRVTVPGRRVEVRHRGGYWALAPGEERLLTPAAAQLMAAAGSGSLTTVVKPKLNAAVLYAPNGELQMPVSVWLPGNPAWLAKSEKGYDTAVTMVLSARNASGKLVAALQKALPVHIGSGQFAEFQRAGSRISAYLAVPALEPLKLQAILLFSNGTAAVGTREIAAGPHLTSLLLTPRVRATEAAEENEADCLKVQGYRLVLPSEARFGASDSLTLYFGVDGLGAQLAAGAAIKSGGKVVRQLPSDAFVPLSGGRLLFLKQYSLEGLGAGDYTLEVALRDRASGLATTQSADFVIQ